MKFILFLALLFKSHAWSPEFNSKWSQTNKTHSLILSDAKFATFWGGVRRAIYWPRHQGHIHNIKPNGFVKDLPIYLKFSKNKKDLVLFYPGVFGLADGEVTPIIIDEIEKRDIHVAVIPNLTSAEFQKARKNSGEDLFEQEGKNQFLIIQKIFDTIGSENIRQVHILGESLGCFQVMMGLMNESYAKMRIENVTFLWPPLHLDRAVKRFDEMIQNSTRQNDLCTLWWKWPNVIYESKFNTLPDLSSEDKDCFGSFVIGSVFVKAIKKNSISFLNESQKTPQNFSDFIHLFLPELKLLIKNQDKRFSIDFQLSQIKYPKEYIHFITSKDDFLNSPVEWAALRKHYPDLTKRLFIFDWGGHSGPVGLDGLIDSILNERLTPHLK